MPILNQPTSLEVLTLESLGDYIYRECLKAIDATGSGRTPEINIDDIHHFLYADLPSVVSCKLAIHVLSDVVKWVLQSLTISEEAFDEYGETDVKNIMKSIILASLYPQITSLDMSIFTTFAQRILISNIHTFENLHSLNFSNDLPSDILETLPRVLSVLKCLVIFEMEFICTDAIIETLGLCCSGTIEHIDVDCSEKVTNVSFEILKTCKKLKHLLLWDTSVTAKGYAKLLQYKKSDDTAKDLLRISIGAPGKWYVTSRQMNEIAVTCPMLKQLEISELSGNMEIFASLTELEALWIQGFDFGMCNLEGFLRVRGSNIITLSLTLAGDSIDIMSIMNHCINIKKLIITESSIMDTGSGSENAAKAFQKLEVLDLEHSYGLSPSSIERVLYACVNLRRFGIISIEDTGITDQNIQRLLANNPLKKLTSFLIPRSELSMKSANAFIEHCPLLKRLGHLNMWKGVTDAEIEILVQQIRETNQNLRIM